MRMNFARIATEGLRSSSRGRTKKTDVAFRFPAEERSVPCDDEKVIRISVGAEDFEEIIADLERILGKNL